MESFFEGFSDGTLILTAGLFVGLLFGASANVSQFCLRAAIIEGCRFKPGNRFAIWFLVFGTSLLLTQWLFETSSLDREGIRQLTGTGSLSGAAIGGLLFGAGMILARGCASRLLVLSATGNVRAIVTGLILTIVAQASVTGVLAPLREWFSALFLVTGNARDLATFLPLHAPMIIAAGCLALALIFAVKGRSNGIRLVAALATGGAIVLGWYLTYTLSQWSFEAVSVQSVTFTGPSTETLMALIYKSDWPMEFGFGLVPGVFLGSLVATLAKREFKVRAFDAESGMMRYLFGAIFMGFGGMLAGGCAVGAGVTGGSVMALTAWLALAAMWVGAGVTDMLIDRPAENEAADMAEPTAQPTY